MPNPRHFSNAANKQADIQYFQTFMGHQLRPNAKMPIDQHQYCEQVLRQVAKATQGRQGAHQAVLFVRGTLDDWAMREWGVSVIGHKLADSLFYFDEKEPILSNRDLIFKLRTVEMILDINYKNGKALKKVSNFIEKAIKSICTWNGKPRGKILRRTHSWRESMQNHQQS